MKMIVMSILFVWSLSGYARQVPSCDLEGWGGERILVRDFSLWQRHNFKQVLRTLKITANDQSIYDTIDIYDGPDGHYLPEGTLFLSYRGYGINEENDHELQFGLMQTSTGSRTVDMVNARSGKFYPQFTTLYETDESGDTAKLRCRLEFKVYAQYWDYVLFDATTEGDIIDKFNPRDHRLVQALFFADMAL